MLKVRMAYTTFLGIECFNEEPVNYGEQLASFLVRWPIIHLISLR